MKLELSQYDIDSILLALWDGATTAYNNGIDEDAVAYKNARINILKQFLTEDQLKDYIQPF
jgi:hypothetical protein